MRRHILVATVAVLLSSAALPLFADDSTRSLPTWIKTYGTADSERLQSMRPTADGGWVLAGATSPVGSYCMDASWLCKLDASGQVQFSKTYPSIQSSSMIQFIRPTPDGGYIAAGTAGCYPYTSCFLLKLDSAGNTQWTKGFSLGMWAESYGLELAPDGGYTLLALVNTGSQSQILLVKFDTSGNLLWAKSYASTADAYPSALASVPGGYYISGAFLLADDYTTEALLLKVDLSGTLVWQKRLGGAANEEFGPIRTLSDGGCIVAGWSNSFGGAADLLLVRFGASGSIAWQRRFGTVLDDTARAMVPTSDGGLLLEAFTSPPGRVSRPYGTHLFFKMDAAGSIAWQRSYSLADGMRTDALTQGTDGGYACALTTEDYGAGANDAMLLKLPPDGQLLSPCPLAGDPGTTVQATTFTPTTGPVAEAVATVTPYDISPTPQTYTVSASTVCSASIPCQITCSASVSPAQGTAPLSVNFSASATLTYCQATASYQWEFGDGGVSVQKNTSHTYTLPGTYTWTLTVTAEGTACTQSGSVTVGAACQVTCEATVPEAGTAGAPLTFALAASIAGCTSSPSFSWTFGDGTSSAEQNPTHIYELPGTYNWSATVTADGVACTRSGAIVISPPCTLDCSATVPASAVPGAPVEFILFVAPPGCGEAEFLWAFGDGNTSAEQNPVHAYAAPGSYSWNARANAGDATCEESGTILIAPACSVECTAYAPSSVDQRATVYFLSHVTSSDCAGVPTFHWAFGDGTYSQAPDPLHAYPDAGTYAWTLTVEADGVYCRRGGSITVDPVCTIACDAHPDKDFGASPLTVAFASSSSTTACPSSPSGVWDFGDGATSTALNPSHTYSTPGKYRWTFTASAESVACSRNGIVTVLPPGAGVELLTWGQNLSGQLGDGTLNYVTRPQRATVAARASALALGGGTWDPFTVLLKPDGTVWTVGQNSRGQLGDGTTEHRTDLAQVPGLTDVVAVSAGAYHALALKSDGTVWSWGANGSGQLGDGTTQARTSPVRVGSLTGIVTIAAGGYYGMALDADGAVWAWGINTYGQLGDGTTERRSSPVRVQGLAVTRAIAAGYNHSLASDASGAVWAWGVGRVYLGTGANDGAPHPIPAVVPGIAGVTSLAAGIRHSCALTESGELWVWGNDTHGQLGIGHGTGVPSVVGGLPALAKVAAGPYTTLVAAQDGTAWAWGSSSQGQAGNGSTQNQMIPALLTGPAGVVCVAGNETHSGAVQADGTVWMWGAGEAGQLLDGRAGFDVDPNPRAGLTGIDGFSAGDCFTLARKTDRTAVSWGFNYDGELGDGTTSDRPSLVAVQGLTDIRQLAGGWDFSLALRRDGTVWSWGGNGYGELGDGTEESRSLPAQVPLLHDIVSIATGDAFGLALRSDGTVWTWGFNENGQLGDGTWLSRNLPAMVPGLTDIVGIGTQCWEAGYALRSDGTVWSWGMNNSGTLGDGTTVNRNTPVQALGLTDIVEVKSGGHHALALERDGSLWGWGSNDEGQLGDGTRINRPLPQRIPGIPAVADFAGGEMYSFAVQPDGSLWAWGENDYGQIGDGTRLNRLVPGPVSTVGQVAKIHAGVWHSVALASRCALTCDASAAPASGTAPLTVAFQAAATSAGCSGTPSFAWDFGDGATSAEQNPRHTYTAGGTFTWTLTITLNGTSCTRSGSVAVSDPCSLSCSADASPISGLAPLTVAFQGSVSSSHCTGTPTFRWSFGDGGSSTAEDPTHVYSRAGTFTWTFTAELSGLTCSKSGTVVVAQIQGSLSGTAAIRGGADRYALDGTGIMGVTALLYDLGGALVASAPAPQGAFQLDGIPIGTYDLKVKVQYTDYIAFDASYGEYGCARPPTGILLKTLYSGPLRVTVAEGSTSVAVDFPPPVIFLHGALQCYSRWFSDSPDDPDFLRFWDNAAREAGFFSFTPNYTWYGSAFSWPTAADQVADQVDLDLAGLHMPTSRAQPTPYVPWTLVAHDMGGLVARVLALGSRGEDAFMDSIGHIFLIGAPNSGSDMLLGGGDNSLLSVNSVIRRFNEVYPDFGRLDNAVTAVAGDEDWWDGGSGDGPLTLQSALSITRLACSRSGGNAQCTPYAHHAYGGNDGRVYSYGHYALGAPPSEDEVLMGLILSASRRADPESPAGGTMWGTGARTTGTTSGTATGRATSTDAVFPIGTTDGMAIGAWVTQGVAMFQVLDPDGQVVSSHRTSREGYQYPGYLFTRLNPAPGEWTLRVMPEEGSASFSATAVENSPFGITAYVGLPSYFAGDTAEMGLKIEGDFTGATVGSVSATVFSPSGAVLQAVTLSPQGQRYLGSVTVPQDTGSYPVTFALTGTYAGQPFVRTAYERLNVLGSGRAAFFTGNFADHAQDRDGDGKFDAIVFEPEVSLPSAGAYAFSADLYDASGVWIAHAADSLSSQGPTTASATLVFPFVGTCSQLNEPLSAGHLFASDGTTLIPIAAWPSDIPTRQYDAGQFVCDPSALPPAPTLSAVRPDEGIRGMAVDLVLSGANLSADCTVSLGDGVTVNGVSFLTENVLEVSASILPDAAPGLRTITVRKPSTVPVYLPDAFEVKASSTPRASILSPVGGDTLSGVVLVTASASGDLPVSRVDFIVDDGVVASDSEFPYQYSWDTARWADGPHTVRARNNDQSGQSADSEGIAVTVRNTIVPGDCDGDGTVSIGEVQKAVNMFLGIVPPDCGVDCNGDGVVSIGEVQKVINAFLGVASFC